MIRPRIVLHIGRNKCGSTTIQDFCLAARKDLLDRGVSYTLFGHLWDSQPGVPGFQRFSELADHARRFPDQVHLVSNEFMFHFPEDYVTTAERELEGCDVTLVAYLRPYDAWIRSAYAEETRHGRNILDIDGFARLWAERESALPFLERWGGSFGWDRFHIRTLDGSSLHGGDLLADFLHALGVAPIDGPVLSRNASPHWCVLELARLLARGNSDVDWQGVDTDEVLPLMAAMADASRGVPKIPVWTVMERQRLIDRYNADLDRLEQLGAGPLTRASVAFGGERRAIPSLNSVPAETLGRFFEIVLAADFMDRHLAAALRANALAKELTSRHLRPRGAAQSR